jgi:hypothetical protein
LIIGRLPRFFVAMGPVGVGGAGMLHWDGRSAVDWA